MMIKVVKIMLPSNVLAFLINKRVLVERTTSEKAAVVEVVVVVTVEAVEVSVVVEAVTTNLNV